MAQQFAVTYRSGRAQGCGTWHRAWSEAPWWPCSRGSMTWRRRLQSRQYAPTTLIASGEVVPTPFWSMMFCALFFAADILAGLVARVKKLRMKLMVGEIEGKFDGREKILRRGVWPEFGLSLLNGCFVSPTASMTCCLDCF